MKTTFVFLLYLCSFVFTYAQSKVITLSQKEVSGDVYYFIERVYKARMAFGELEKGDLIGTSYFRFDLKGNLLYYEDKDEDGKKENIQYVINNQENLEQIIHSNGEKTIFTYNNNRLVQFDKYDKDGKLLSRTKRKYNTANDFVDIEYNGNGEEERQFVYKNGLHVLTKSGQNTTRFSYNAQGKETASIYNGKQADYDGNFLTFYLELITEGKPDVKTKDVTTTTNTYYNSAGLMSEQIKTKNGKQTEKYDFRYKYDSKGNWIECVASCNAPEIDEIIVISEREIKYYSECDDEPNYTTLTDIENAKEEIKYTTSLPDREATYPGGTDALNRYLAENVKYPIVCAENGVQGEVAVSFIVDRDGSVIEAEVVKKVDLLLDREAVRVISNMPKWNPGIKDGEFVRSQHTVSVKFALQ